MKRFYEDYSNLELANLIQSHGILDDGIPEAIRETILRFLWRDQAFESAKRLPITSTEGDLG